jgi:hypothetical protein
MTETWQDKAFKDPNRTWVFSQHVRKVQAPCGCRLSVYADDVLDGPQLDTSRCTASTAIETLERVKAAKAEITKLKKEVASL